MKLLGMGADLLCKRTNARAKRRQSEGYLNRWIDLTPGGRLCSFLAVYIGSAVLGVGPRDLMRKTPSWISQQGEGRLFEKLTTDLYRLWSANFVAHTHNDSILFRKSIREQRCRFYGNEELNQIIYGNSRKARDPPISVSGDETITRLYTRKATDIRMRTAKKNESGIMNHNICGTNVGYTTRKESDPKGNGYTYANICYPGSLYNRGSMFREKDMGNLIQLIFSCGDYFRFKNLELITDSHFGHLVPMAYLRLWQIYATASFNPKQRLGVSGIPEFSKNELSKMEIQELLESHGYGKEEKSFDPLADSEESDEKEDKRIQKQFRQVKTRMQFYEKDLSMKPKGFFQV